MPASHEPRLVGRGFGLGGAQADPRKKSGAAYTRPGPWGGGGLRQARPVLASTIPPRYLVPQGADKAFPRYDLA